MKVNKKGQIKLNANDVRIKNFVFTNEPEYIKFQDINTQVSLRLKKNISLRAVAVEQALIAKDESTLEQYAYFFFLSNTMMLDADCFSNILKEFVDCTNRHKDLFGIKENISKEDDEMILKEQKEFQQAIEKLSAETEIEQNENVSS